MTLGLAITGRLALYINPSSSWFAIGMAVLVLVGTVASFALPLGAEEEHGHDHGDAAARHDDHEEPHDDHDHEDHGPRRHPVALAATAVGGIAASVVVASIVLLPPASLSAQLAMSRDTGVAPLFAGRDAVTLASTGDTSSFGIGDWAAVFATATNPDAFDGDAVTLTGFATPAGSKGGFQLTRLIITHCVIDAQPASVPVGAAGAPPATGAWVTVTGTVRARPDGSLAIDAASVEKVAEPKDPYEY